MRIDDGARPGRARSISARLGRSNDGQDHALSPYATLLRPEGLRRASAPFVPHGLRELTGVGSILCPPCPQHPRRRCRVHRIPGPRSTRRTIAPHHGPGWRENALIPNFGKEEYFCIRGLTGFCGRRVFCPTGLIGRADLRCSSSPPASHRAHHMLAGASKVNSFFRLSVKFYLLSSASPMTNQGLQ